MPEHIVAKIRDIGIKGRLHNIVQRPEPAYSAEEKSEQLWGLFIEYSAFRRKSYKDILRSTLGERIIGELTADERGAARKELAENLLTQRLEGEISRLWEDPSVRSVFQTKLKEALAEQEFHTPNLSTYRELRERYYSLQDEYFDFLRNQFLLRQMTPTLRAIEIARNRTETDLVKKHITYLEENGGMVPELIAARGGLDKEHADLAALLTFDKIKEYHRQYRASGVVFTPSREDLFEDTVRQISSRTWMLFTGETGTGKSTFGKRTSFILNGEPPQYASGEERGDVTRLIGTKSMTSEGKTYYEFGPLTVAATGCQNSLEMEEALRSGRQPEGKLLLLDEINKFNQDALFGALKVIATLNPGEEFNFKELPGITLKMAHRGFGFIATRNPNSERYERKELDPAIARLLKDGERKVDYPPMTQKNPELYEIFLSILMDDNGRVRVSRDEIAPAYDKRKDEAKGIITKEIAGDPKRHGALYRFALASAEIHKSFSQKDSVAKTASDPGFLETTVLDMQVLANWMENYRQEVEGGASLSTYLENKLHDFYENIESVNDKSVFKRVFDQFGFNIESPTKTRKPPHEILTPAEIGYLSPRVKNYVTMIGEEAVPHTKVFVLQDGTELQYLPVSIVIKNDKSLLPHSLITHNGKTIKFLGKDPLTGKARFVNEGEGQVIDLPEPEIVELFNNGQMVIVESPKAEPIRRVEADIPIIKRAREILGRDFLGEEAIKNLEEKLKKFGVNVKFVTRDENGNLPQFPYTEEDLRLARENGEMLVLRPELMLRGGIGVPLTMIELRELFRKDPLKIMQTVVFSFRPDASDWYMETDFATTLEVNGKKPMKLGWRLVTKNVLDGSTNIDWNGQEELLRKYETSLRSRRATNTSVVRRTSTEAFYDLLLYYINTGVKLLPNKLDGTQTRAPDGSPVYVGLFSLSRLSVYYSSLGNETSLAGVCPSR